MYRFQLRLTWPVSAILSRGFMEVVLMLALNQTDPLTSP